MWLFFFLFLFFPFSSRLPWQSSLPCILLIVATHAHWSLLTFRLKCQWSRNRQKRKKKKKRGQILKVDRRPRPGSSAHLVRRNRPPSSRSVSPVRKRAERTSGEAIKSMSARGVPRRRTEESQSAWGNQSANRPTPFVQPKQTDGAEWDAGLCGMPKWTLGREAMTALWLASVACQSGACDLRETDCGERSGSPTGQLAAMTDAPLDMCFSSHRGPVPPSL